MRVLWVSNETPDRFGQGGQRRQYFQIVALAEYGHHVRVVAVASGQSDASLRRIATVERYRTALLPRFPVPVRWRQRLLAERAAAADRVVVAHTESWETLGRMAFACPALLDMHNVMSRWYERRGDMDLRARAVGDEAAALDAFDVVSVCSVTEADWLASDGPRPVVLPHGVDPSEWSRSPHDIGAAKVALFGSWTWPPNGAGLCWFLREVWPIVRHRIPHAVAEVAGVNIPTRLVESPGVVARGRVDDLAEFLQGAAVVAVPVRTGVGASVKFAEALASGSAVVSTVDAAQAAPGAPAFISDDPEAWADRICSLVSDRAAARREGRVSRDYALARLSWTDVTRPLGTWIDRPAR